MTKKTIDQIPQHLMDCYEASNAMHSLQPGDKGYNDSRLAAQAHFEMVEAGWKFHSYNEFGEEVWEPPAKC